MGAAQQSPVLPENWVEYYRTGSGFPPNVQWNLNQIDVNSVRRHGDYVRYRVRVQFFGGEVGEFQEMQADCAGRTRGQFPDPRMNSTYEGTLGGDEVKAACFVAAQRQL
jgi:hypothetical protein